MLGLHHEKLGRTGNAAATIGADMKIRNTETADNTAICHDLRITLKIPKVVSNLGTLSIGGNLDRVEFEIQEQISKPSKRWLHDIWPTTPDPLTSARSRSMKKMSTLSPGSPILTNCLNPPDLSVGGLHPLTGPQAGIVKPLVMNPAGNSSTTGPTVSS